ncbi:MAG: hypothetical protein NVS1B7_0660 [Candidatus Saccharimonadales bacterium]
MLMLMNTPTSFEPSTTPEEPKTGIVEPTPNETVTERPSTASETTINDITSTTPEEPKTGIVEPTPNETVTERPIATPTPAQSEPAHTPGHIGTIVGATIALLLILIAGAGSYVYATGIANKKIDDVKRSSAAANVSQELSIPAGATVIAECAKGRGKQYVLPKDIPLGPVYNVSEGKVIGIEYMVGKDDLIGSTKNFLNLPLNNIKYDHVNIGLLSQGHAGFPSPHYHVDVMMVPTSVTDKITCTK